jgi:hypothetical protein
MFEVYNMKKFMYIVIVFMCFLASDVRATNRIESKEGNLVFSLSDEWKQNSVLPKRDAKDPSLFAWKRESIIGENGHSVSAGLNIIVSNIQPDANVMLVSHSLMTQRRWPFKQFLTAEKDGLVMPNTVGYFTEYRPRNDILLKVFVIHTITNGKFVEVILSATDDIFTQIEPEFKAIIQSIRLIQEQ